jgi:hypothetical protein
LNSPGDGIAPTTAAVLSPAPNASGWNNSNGGVTLNATDNQGGSGVTQIAYSATGSQPIASTTVPGSLASLTVRSEGATAFSYYATDSAGNVETPKSATIPLDKTAPVATYAGNPGSFNVDQTVNITCSAAHPPAPNGSAGSGLASTTCRDIWPGLRFRCRE